VRVCVCVWYTNVDVLLHSLLMDSVRPMGRNVLLWPCIHFLLVPLQLPMKRQYQTTSVSYGQG